MRAESALLHGRGNGAGLRAAEKEGQRRDRRCDQGQDEEYVGEAAHGRLILDVGGEDMFPKATPMERLPPGKHVLRQRDAYRAGDERRSSARPFERRAFSRVGSP
jgi:hypothetical protein